VPAVPTILVGRIGSVLWMRVSGKGTFQNSVEVKRCFQSVIAAGTKDFVVDLECCPTMDSTFLGTLTGSPELTGNALAELWGFFPDATPMSVRQIDRTNGETLREIDVSVIDGIGLGASAWAFAFWGGRYYLFYMGALDVSTSIWRVDPGTGAVDSVAPEIGYRIVGAGVSTCAPVVPF